MTSQGAPTAGRAAKDGAKFRRTRIPLSCDPCRTRKLKCNREKPCQNCTTRKEQGACKYRGARNGATPPLAREVGGDAMRQRIDHLEGLVKKLIAGHQVASTPSIDAVPTPESPAPEVGPDRDVLPPHTTEVPGTGTMVMDGIHSVYRGPDDWLAVLQEINELKRTWSEEQEDHSDYNFGVTPSHSVDGSSLLFNQAEPIERLEILSTLPPRHEVDRLISQFFNPQSFPLSIPPILHEPTFMREYEEHWKDPSKTNLIWLGLLFSILGINMLAYHKSGEPPEYEGISESLFQLYRMRTAQCLLSGDIAKCLPYTVETLRFNATAELNRKDDNRRGLWLMTGVVIRAAVNMGYHRDPSQSPGISVLQGEYRRRVWAAVITMDEMASFRGGFPRMMPSMFSDTLEPSNLHDWELSYDMSSLPPSRPLSEPTAATYLIVKRRLTRALCRITDFNSTPCLGPYETVLDIDRDVYEAYENIPSHMKALPAEDVSNPIYTMMKYSDLSLLGMYHKGMCMLHRKYLAIGRLDGRFKFSRDRCIASALAILAFQEVLEPAFYTFAQTRQMLTLAAMVVYLELELRRKAAGMEVTPDNSVLTRALEGSCNCWAKATRICDEALRIHQSLVEMLSAFHIASHTDEVSAKQITPESPFGLTGFGSRFEVPNGRLFFEEELPDVDLDWTTWDTFLEEPNYEAGPMY